MLLTRPGGEVEFRWKRRLHSEAILEMSSEQATKEIFS